MTAIKSILTASLVLASLSACSAPINNLPAQLRAQNAGSVDAQGKPKTLQVRLFRSYGNEGTVHVRARVMRPENQRPENAQDSTLLNFWRALTSLSVKEVAGVKVDLSLNGKTLTLISNNEGMIQTPAEVFGPLPAGIHPLRATLSPGQTYTAPAVSENIVVQASTDNSLSVVSDIDDTIKISNVTNKLKSLRRLLFSNAYTVEPIPGTAVLYQRLEFRGDGLADGDTQYVSGSPINLAESIYRFMDFRGFPKGAVDLKKWGFGAGDDSPFAQQNYKVDRLRKIFTTYPQRSFLLFGDSGEKDPEIYRQIATEFPGRVRAIFINNVTKSQPTDPRFQGLNLTNSALDQARILQQQGLLNAADVDAVAKAVNAEAAYARLNPAQD